MGANMRCEKNSLALLSSKRTKAFSRTRADEAFALPSFSDVVPTFTIESPCRPGGGPKVEHCSKDVERLKQTMLQHESMFKEQLHELHRLYQVQQLLMEESKRKGPAPSHHPRSDSPSSNSSLLYNPDACKPKGETRLWDAKETSKTSLCKQLAFFPGLIDMNKPHEDKSCAERRGNVLYPKGNPRPIIDLEQPAEEHVEIDVEEEKPLVKDMLLKTVGNSHMWHGSWQALQNSMPSEESADVRSITMHRESLGSTRRSLEDCFTPELSRHKEVPFSPLGPNMNGDGGANLCHVQAAPVTSLFGVRLNQESTNREKQTQAGPNNLEEKRKELQIFSTDTGRRSTGEPSKLPHWLLQGSPTKTSPAAQNLLRQHQTSPFVMQKHDERKADSIFNDRVCSVSPQELSSSWPKSGTRLQFGESLLRAPQGKPSSGYFLETARGNVQGLHKLAQTSSLIESVPFLSHSRDERGAGGLQIPATVYVTSPTPTTNKQSPVYDTHAAPTASFLQNLCSKGTNNGAPMPSWYQQQKASSPLMPQVSQPGIQSQRSSNAAFPVNSWNAWGNSSAREEVQPGIFARGTIDAGGENTRNLEGSSPSFVAKPEVSSKRLIFGFMPTASDLELTLGLDLNESGTLEILKSGEDSSMLENVAERDNSKIDLESKPMRNDFDLNVQSGQGLEACCPEDPAESHVIPQGHEAERSYGWRTPPEVKPIYHEERQTLHTSSGSKNIHKVAITSTGTPLWSANSSFLKVDMHREENLHVTSANGGVFVAGKSSDGLVLTSCESRSMPIPASPKARDDSNTHCGERCQSSEVKISTQNECGAFSSNLPSKSPMQKLPEEASMMAGRQPGMFSAMFDVVQGDIAEDLLVTKCTDVDNGKAAANNADKHVTEAFEAADILLDLGLDLAAAVIEDHDADDQERTLKWLADIIPQDEVSGVGAGMTDFATRESMRRAAEPPLEGVGFQGRELDSFELAVLRLKTTDPDTEKVCTPPIERWDVAEDCSPHPNLRRRSQRRGRVGKDFQKEMLPSMASLSRQEITEDLQIIEGLVKSATEAMARCSLSPNMEEVPWSLPDLSPIKTSAKAKGSRSCKAGKQPHTLLRVCSWGESTRRRRMRRQRSQWMCLPPGV